VERLILRLVEKEVEHDGEDVFRIHYIGGLDEIRIDRYLVRLKGLIVQRPDMPDALRIPPHTMTIAPQPWNEYCHWHSGPIHEKDDPATRIYCTVRAEGFCRQHKRTLRAFYEYCMSLRGGKALGACKMVDKEVRTEYAVYLTDGGASKPKVGVTRAFRVYERIAEQWHNAATILTIVDSAYKARTIEMELSKRGIATEVQARRKTSNLGGSLRMLISAAEEAARLLGVDWDRRLFRVVPRSLVAMRSMKETRLEQVEGETLALRDYWAGMILAVDRHGRPLLLRSRRLVHRDSLLASPGDGGESAEGLK